MMDLMKVSYALEDLTRDDRMDRNAQNIGDRHRAQLQSHIDRLQKVLDKIQ